MIPREICRKIEAFLGIDQVYTVGFSLGKEAMGGLSVLLPAGQELRFGSAIETFANHLSVLMHRIQAEEALQESRERYRRLSQACARYGKSKTPVLPARSTTIWASRLRRWKWTCPWSNRM